MIQEMEKKMKKIISLAGLSLALLTTSVFAQDAQKMQNKLNKDFANLQVEKVEYLKNLNLYELTLKDDNNPAYTNESNDFFFIAGQIVDVKNKVNYSKERLFIRVKNLYNSLPFDKAITVKYGNGTRKIAVFTDPDCPFCKKLDEEIHKNMKNDDITIYYFMNPLNIVGHEQAPLKAAKIWCSKDKSQAWIDWMLNGKLPNNPGTCKNPVAETREIGIKAGYNSTPTIVFDNGYTASQTLTADQIRKVFEARQP